MTVLNCFQAYFEFGNSPFSDVFSYRVVSSFSIWLLTANYQAKNLLALLLLGLSGPSHLLN